MSIKFHHGKWYAVNRDPSGRQRSEVVSTRKSDAKTRDAEIKTDMRRGVWVDPKLGSATFATWAAEWRSTVVHLKPLTLAGYDGLLRNYLLPAFGTIRLGRVTQPQVKGFVAGLVAKGLSPSRVRQANHLGSMIFKEAVAAGYLAKTPWVGIKVPRDRKREPIVLEPEQIDALATAAEPYGVLIYVLAYGGLRWGEMAAVRRERCDILRARIDVVEAVSEVGGHIHTGPPKSYARRSIRLPRFVAEMLGEHLAKIPPGGLVFTAPGGGPLRASNFRRRVWLPATAAIDVLGLTPHHLRHTCASLLIRRGASIKAVQAQLGHSTPVVTLNVYSHLFADDLDALYRDVDHLWTKRAANESADHGV
jgi:integrase